MKLEVIFIQQATGLSSPAEITDEIWKYANDTHKRPASEPTLQKISVYRMKRNKQVHRTFFDNVALSFHWDFDLPSVYIYWLLYPNLEHWYLLDVVLRKRHNLSDEILQVHEEFLQFYEQVIQLHCASHSIMTHTCICSAPVRFILNYDIQHIRRLDPSRCSSN